MDLKMINAARNKFDRTIESEHGGGGMYYPGNEKSSGGIVEYQRQTKPYPSKLKGYPKKKRKPSNNKWLKFYKSECKRQKYKKMNSRKCMSEIAKEYRKQNR